MMKSLILLVLFVVQTALAEGLLPTAAKSNRAESEKKIRELLSQIPLDMNSCLAQIEPSYPNVLETLHCDGELLLKNRAVIEVESMFRKVTSAEATTVFIGVMLDAGFELKSVSSSRATDSYIFQRARPRDKVGSEGF